MNSNICFPVHYFVFQATVCCIIWYWLHGSDVLLLHGKVTVGQALDWPCVYRLYSARDSSLGKGDENLARRAGRGGLGVTVTVT